MQIRMNIALRITPINNLIYKNQNNSTAPACSLKRDKRRLMDIFIHYVQLFRNRAK